MAEPVGVLLAQLGTPEGPTAPALRRYLRQFLGDPRVLEMNRLARWLLLNLVILPSRPKRSARLYRKIWTEKGSPLLLTTLSQAQGLERALGPAARVAAGMRYGEPSLAAALETLLQAGSRRILLFPMYPQYSGATTGSTCDELFRSLSRKRVVPPLRVAAPYGAHPAYLEAVVETARQSLSALPFEPEKVLISFHGIPRRFIERGDPYRAQCEESAGLIARGLGLPAEKWMLVFQSRLGREPWLEPYADETFLALGRAGLKRIAVICPGFTADCLETLDEIRNLGREQFRSTGGEELRQVPCLNDQPAWISAMARIAREELSGWL
jgi:ferrochelatase